MLSALHGYLLVAFILDGVGMVLSLLCLVVVIRQARALAAEQRRDDDGAREAQHQSQRERGE